MTRFLIIFAIALIPVQVLLSLGYQYYGVQLTLTGIILRTLGGLAVAGYVAWRIERQLGGFRKKPGAEREETPLYQRPTFDQLANLGGRPPETPAQQPPADTPPATGAPLTLADRLRQQQAKRD